jgi:hypothetical protein
VLRGMTAGCNLALAFIGGLSGASALCLALLDCEPFAAACGLAMTTYCAAEFMVRSDSNADTD